MLYLSKIRKKSLGYEISCCLFCITGTQTFNDMFCKSIVISVSNHLIARFECKFLNLSFVVKTAFLAWQRTEN